MGKKHSFICSHTDSLTGNKKPRRKLFPDHSYIKCEMVPVINTNIIPLIVLCFSLFMIVVYEEEREIIPPKKV